MKIEVICPECGKGELRKYEALVSPDDRHYDASLSRVSRATTSCSECKTRLVVTMELSVKTNVSKVHAGAN